jgi:phosphatidylserine/phosphatidylglycerophosphate/cardiolipin synthase-like enzyme
MRWLSEVEAEDEVRIQMFFLARVPVVHAILDAARRTRRPIRILLDPNRVGINYEKDGTPNAQVAAYLLERARLENARIEIRWYATRGEQNHAKVMTITNPRTGKHLMSLGSTNWTRKNLAGINLENNIFLRNAPRQTAQFNELFDRMWTNDDGKMIFSVAWDDPRYNYHRHSGRHKWAIQRRHFFRPRFDAQGRPELLEQEVVHW